MQNLSVPISSISPQPAVHPPAKTADHRWPLWSVIGLIFLVLGIAIGVFSAKFFSRSQSQSQLPPTPISVQSPTPTPTPIVSPEPAAEADDPTADWKTYTNTKYKYFLKYPEGYAAGQNGVNSDSPETVDFLSVFNAENPDKPRLAVSIWQKSQENNLEKMANDHYKKVSTSKPPTGFSLYPGMDSQVIKNISQETFIGYKSFSYTIKGNYIEDGAAEYITPIQNHIYIWFEYVNNIFLVSLDDQIVMNQILSTFQFSDK